MTCCAMLTQGNYLYPLNLASLYVGGFVMDFIWHTFTVANVGLDIKVFEHIDTLEPSISLELIDLSASSKIFLKLRIVCFHILLLCYPFNLFGQ